MSTSNKKLSKRVGLLLVLPLSFGLAGIAVAHPGGGRGGPGGPGAHAGPMSAKMQKCRAEHHAKKLAAVDADKDGAISAEERKLAHENRKASRLAEYDKDKSGDLSKAERKEALHDRMVEKFEKLDTNSNAEVSRAEAEASCAPIGRHFDKADADGNGSVTWTEFESAVGKHMKRGRRGKGMRGYRGKARARRGMHKGSQGAK